MNIHFLNSLVQALIEMNNISDAINMSYDDITAAETTIVNTPAQRSNSLLYYIIYIILSIREYIDNMRPTGARRGRINCGSTILIIVDVLKKPAKGAL